MPKFYLTNAIAYMNAGPHVGHALEMVQGDAITRYHRMIGDDTRFLTGADEHGSKIDQTAKEKGMTPQALVDLNSEIFIELQKLFGCANDDFIRTTSDLHKRGAQKLWAKMEEAGVFYEKDYEGLYCTGCETFYQEKDLVDGLCPNHKKAPELLKEKNLFFKLSAYSDAVRDLILSNQLVIKPESRRNEFLSFLKEGLQDVSFSRPKEVLGWGIEVPNHPDQVMYVWCDALSNYLTALGYAEDDAMVERYWPADVHLIGKDIIRFHCGIWPAMLMAAGLPTPRAVYVHGFITSEGQKMSKSLGNVVDPVELIEKYGQDPVRFYLLREIPTDEDGDFSMNRFRVIYENELQGTIGNLVRRVIAMVIKYQDGKVAAFEGEHAEVTAAWKRYNEGFLNFDVRSSCEAIVELARYANGLIEQSKPWALAKENDPKLALVLSELIHVCRQIGHLLEPIIPATSKAILDQVEGETVQMGEPLFPARDW